jgi:hypothetical protein
MQTITCDICRKKVDEAITGRTFFYLAEHNICEACKDNLEVQIKQTVRTKDPFSYEWYNKLMLDCLGKSVSRGK